jgi:hypothetical protein
MNSGEIMRKNTNPANGMPPLRRAFQVTALIAGCSAVLSLIVFTVAPDVSLSGMRSRTAPSDPIVQQVYYYHTVGAAYDSCNVSCMYGEVVIPAQDSLTVHFFPLCDSTGFEGSVNEVNAHTRTSAFSIAPNEELSFWRAISIQPDHAYQMNLGFPDTLRWTLNLYNAETDAPLATLDSVCIFPQMSGMSAFPLVTGFAGSNSFELVNLSMSGIQSIQGVDSVYLKVLIDPCGGYATSHYIRDDYMVNEKFSSRTEFQKNNPGSRTQAAPATITLTAFPNPYRDNLSLTIRSAEESEHIVVEMFDTAGKRVALLYDGIPGSMDKRIFVTPPPALASGQYTLRARSSRNVHPDPVSVIRVK